MIAAKLQLERGMRVLDIGCGWGGLEAARGFRRFWRYYLLCCAGFFRSRQGQLWQLVLSPAMAASERPAYRSLRPGPCALGVSGA